MLGNALAQYLLNYTVENKIFDCKIYLASREWSRESQDYWEHFSNFVLINISEISIMNLDIDSVIHTASPSNVTKISDINTVREANISLMKQLIEFKPANFIFISSGEVYKGINFFENAPTPKFSEKVKRDWYPLVKLEGEFLLSEYSASSNSSTSSIRLFHTFGPGVKRNDGRSFADILWNAALSNEIILKSEGKQVRSFLYLADAVRAIISILLQPVPGNQKINLGSEKPLSIHDYASVVSKLTGASIKISPEVSFAHSPNSYLVPKLRTIRNYDWKENWELEEGILKTLNWIRGSIQGS
jgi:nucleoside-diphosphate-sugar epimerase